MTPAALSLSRGEKEMDLARDALPGATKATVKVLERPRMIRRMTLISRPRRRAPS
jgi:hypothetical protein